MTLREMELFTDHKVFLLEENGELRHERCSNQTAWIGRRGLWLRICWMEEDIHGAENSVLNEDEVSHNDDADEN